MITADDEKLLKMVDEWLRQKPHKYIKGVTGCIVNDREMNEAFKFSQVIDKKKNKK